MLCAPKLDPDVPTVAVENRFAALFAGRPVILAPMEEVTDALFRRICRRLGAELCVTEFVNVEGLLRGCKKAARKVGLGPGDEPTAIQIYGADVGRLIEAARVAEQAAPAFIDINCGCWVPKIARRGAGSGWLRAPDAMVEMVAAVVRAVALPVTVKTRIGWGDESEMPIVALSRRLEQVGVRALTIHCRTAKAGLRGAADWGWARLVAEAVRIPVVLNGDVRTADDARRAFATTGAAGVMVGRRAIEHPWIFREARSLLDHGAACPDPTVAERFELCREHLRAMAEARGEPYGIRAVRRHLGGYIAGLRGAAELRRRLFSCDTLTGSIAILDEAEPMMRAWHERARDSAEAVAPAVPAITT